MLLEMLSSCPECLDDFLGWRPMSYREHFEASRFKGRDLAIAAYDAADPNAARLPGHAGRHDDRRARGNPRGDERRYAAGGGRPRSPTAPPPGSSRWSRAPAR